jgi:hypothetical protein
VKLFGKLFSGKGKGESDERQKAKQIVENVERRYKPIKNLGSNLIHAICQTAEEVKQYFTPQKLEEPGAAFLLRQEFLYYFLHITQRLAFSQGYTPLERDGLDDAVLSAVLDATLGEIPESHRLDAREVALHNANVAEMDYAKSNGVYPENDPMTVGDSVYAKLARKIEEKLGREHNPEIAFQIIMATSKQARAAQIPDLLKQIRPLVTEV